MAVRLLAGSARHPAFTREFVKATDIQVEIKATHQPHVNDHLMADVFHLLNERLSNLSRHTQARAAEIRLTVENMKSVLRIANDNFKGEVFLHSALRSTTERGATLGSHVGVEPWGHSRSVVMSPIALQESLYACLRCKAYPHPHRR